MKKTIVIVVISVIAILCMGYFGLNSLSKMMYEERSCEWANIDNIELHAHINIPSVIESECFYDTKTNTKTSTFTLDMRELDVKEYLVKNQLKQLTSDSDISIDEIRNFTGSTDTFYFKKYSTKTSDSEVLFDASTGKLHVVIHYHS